MDYEATKLDLLEYMLSDETSKPTDLPISLLKTITNDFSDDLQIGRGGFAVVYKGSLGNGGAVAVKKLSNSIDIDETKYNEEVGCLMSVRHKNIVRFLGYCANTHGQMLDHEGKLVMADVRHRLLCFEYLCNGSLHDYITDASCGLEWRSRYKILKGICKGLCHLHEEHIVHLDLKPTNILLDDNMVPKISDFGLSRRFDENQTRLITSHLYGSLGYLAPEFHSGVITFKSDIYSLGVIFTEILTGQKGYSPVDHILQNWKNRLNISSAEILLEQVRVCAQISIDCMNIDSDKRPDIQWIIKSLDETERTEQFIRSGMITLFTSQVQVQEEQQQDGLMQPYIERLPTKQRRWNLVFRTRLQLPIYKDYRIKSTNSNPLEIILVDAVTCSPVALPSPHMLRVELVPVIGDFPPDGRENWSADEFQKSIVKERNGNRPLLTGDVSRAMRDCHVVVRELRFTDSSSWVRGRKFRIGVCVMPAGSIDGTRVREAITEAFVVRDRHRLLRKHYPPVLTDKVWRLENIRKKGMSRGKLAAKGIHTVQDFVRMLMVKPAELRQILYNMSNKMWEATTKHARSCVTGDRVYAYNAPHGTVYVNSVFRLVKVELGGLEWQLEQLNTAQTEEVHNLILEAYENRDGLQEVDAANGNVPVLQGQLADAEQMALRVIADQTTTL